MALRHSSEVIHAAKRAIARVFPDFTPRQIGHRFIELHYGPELAREVRNRELSKMDGGNELVQAMRPVVAELNRLGVRYYVGGSIASSSHGAARSTLDIDMVVEVDETSAGYLVTALEAEYYVSKQAALDAVRNRSYFNLIHLATSLKIDLFVSRDREFDRSVQGRAATDMLGDKDPVCARVATAEDIILLKLEWYRLGNESSERQWDDLVQVAKLQAVRLDQAYLQRWAQLMGVADLLARLMIQTELERR